MREVVRKVGIFGVRAHEAEAFHSLLGALNPSLTVGVRTTVPFLRAFRIQLFVTESVSRAWKKTPVFNLFSSIKYF